MTWKEIKLATLQKMFSAEGSDYKEDSTTEDYLAGMPQAANEALQLLSTAGKYLFKKLEIAHNPVNNLLSVDISGRIHQISGTYKIFEADAAQSYFFEFLGKGTLEIYIDDVLTSTITLISASKYSQFKGLISNTTGKNIKLKVICIYPGAVKNSALYKDTFETQSEVQSFAPKIRYDLPTLADDFYQADQTQVYFEGDSTISSGYMKTSDFFQEGSKVLVLDRNTPGNYTIYYKAYPPTITKITADDYELPLDPEVEVLLPLYMASQLYKDDDNGIATTYRNEFEIAFEKLSQKPSTPVAESFTSESGWI